VIANVNNIEMGFDDSGSESAIVLLHGFPHNRHVWDEQRDALHTVHGNHYRIITPDLRGFGESQARGPYSMAQYADDLATLLSRLNIQSIILGGLSMGGYIVFEFWRRYPQMVRALILADTRATADNEETRDKRKALIRLAQAEGSAAVAENQMTGMIGATTRTSRPEVVARIRTMLNEAPVDGMVGALTAMMERPDSTPTLATIDVPTLIVVGNEDVITPVKDARAMQAGIPRSTLRIVPDAGHASCLEHPAEFNAVVSEFLRGVA